MASSHDRQPGVASTSPQRSVLDMFRSLHLRYRAWRLNVSPLFASRWYREQYPDVDSSGMNAALHYLVRGSAEGRWPHPVFDPGWFKRNARTPISAGQTTLEHYLSISPEDRPSPHPLFDPAWYRGRYPEAADPETDALMHFIKTGGRQGYSPHPEFDSGWYLAQYPDVEKVGVNPLVHYLNAGAKERRDPSPRFSTRSYVNIHSDVARASINPLVHYIVSGKGEGRITDISSGVYRDSEEPQARVSPDHVRIWGKRAQSLLSECLRQRPWPMIDWKSRIVVSWSAKSACTHVLIWHLDRLGLLDDMAAESSWPHDYRVRTYYSLPEYQRALNSIAHDGPGEWTYLKVVRDPCNRCISSYRHALAHGYADRLMSHFLGRPISHREGYSYADFLEYLHRIDLQHCDIHHRLQRHPLDPAPFGKKILINIDEQDLESSLAHVKGIRGDISGEGNTRRKKLVRRAARRHATESGRSSEDPDVWLKPLTRDDVGRWPKSELQGCRSARELARQLYLRDYAMFDWFGRQCEDSTGDRQ